MADAVGTVYLDSTKDPASIDRRSLLRGVALASPAFVLPSVVVAEDPHVALWRRRCALWRSTESVPEDETTRIVREALAIDRELASTPPRTVEAKRAVLEMVRENLRDFGTPSVDETELRALDAVIAAL